MDLKEQIKESAKRLQVETGWRYGQSVFNHIDSKYGVAREVQHEYHIDCFYDDNKVDEFIDAAIKIISQIGKG